MDIRQIKSTLEEQKLELESWVSRTHWLQAMPWRAVEKPSIPIWLSWVPSLEEGISYELVGTKAESVIDYFKTDILIIKPDVAWIAD